VKPVRIHAREPLAVPQIVDFDGNFDQNVVRGMEPVAEPNYMRTQSVENWLVEPFFS
jgi:hypothetical protein